MILTRWLRQIIYCLSIFDMKDLGETYYVLSKQILRNRPSGIIRLFQQTYIERILKRFNTRLCSSGKTPIVKGDRFSKGQCPHNDIERDKMKVVPYSSVVSSLMYVQVCTRLDIAFIVGVLSRYSSDPSQSYWKVAKKVLRYLRGTKDLMLTYRYIDPLEVVGFNDSDYVGCVDDKRSTMAEEAISWKSVKQTITTSSTMEVEYVACYEATCHAIWLRNFISALEVVHSISRPLKLLYDNSVAVSFSRNTRNTYRSKYIDVKFFL